MKKRKSLLKTSVFVLGALEIFNKVIDSSSIVNTNTRTGGKYLHWKHGDVFYQYMVKRESAPSSHPRPDSSVLPAMNGIISPGS